MKARRFRVLKIFKSKKTYEIEKNIFEEISERIT